MQQPNPGDAAAVLDSGGVFKAHLDNYPGGGGYVRRLSCAKERVIWEKTTYAQLAVRYNCHYGRGTVNWDQRLAPASDYFVYQWSSARQYGTVRIDLNWDCQLVS